MLLFILGCLQADADLVKSEGKPVIPLYVSNVHNNADSSSVKIIIYDEEDQSKEIGHGSSNYFRYRGHHFLLTAAHVVSEKNPLKIEDGSNLVDLQIVYIDFETDIAILKPATQLKNIEPLKWSNRKSELRLGEKIYYAGYPSHYDKVLISGMVSSLTERGMIIQSFALPGSSGSVVFDKSGRVLGVVSAVGIGYTPVSPYPVMQEDLVFVSTIAHIDNRTLIEVLECGS